MRLGVNTRRDEILGCLLWTAGVNSKGYPIARIGARVVLVRRELYAERYGPIADGIVLRSTCQVKRCVEPAHLEPMAVEVARRQPRRRQRP